MNYDRFFLHLFVLTYSQ